MPNGESVDLRTAPALRDDERAEALIPAAGSPGEGPKAVRLASIEGESRTDAEVGAVAFRNPPADLDAAEKTAAREAIGAGAEGQTGGTGTDATARAGVRDNAAAILAEREARAEADMRIEGKADANVSGLQSEARTRATEDAALGGRVTAAAREAAEAKALVPAARLRIEPATFRDAAAIRGTHTAILDELREDALFDGVNPAINRFRLIETETGTPVHTEAWAYSPLGDLQIQFEISAQEASDIGTTGSDRYITFQGQFLNTAGAVVARTNRLNVAIGDRPEFPATRGEIPDVSHADPEAIRELQERTHDLSVLREQPNYVPADAADGGIALIAQGTADFARVGQGRAPTAGVFAPQVSPPSDGTYLAVVRLTLEEAHNLTKYRYGQVIDGHTNFVLMGNFQGYASDATWVYYGVHAAQPLTTSDRFTLQHAGDAHFTSYHGDVAQRTANETVAKALVDSEGNALGTDSEGRVQLPESDEPAPFADIEIRPGGLPGSDFPPSIYILMDERLTSRTIDGLTLNFGGFPLTLHASTPVASFADSSRGLARFDVPADDRDTLKANNANRDHTTAELVFSFTEGDDYPYSLVFPVNNPSFGTRVQSASFAGALTINRDAGEIADVTLTGDTVLNVEGGGDGDSLLVRALQDGTGGRALTLNNAVRRLPGVPTPALSTAAGARDVLRFARIGALWYYVGISNELAALGTLDDRVEALEARSPTSVQNLTDGANIAWDATHKLVRVTLAGNRAVQNPTNVRTSDVLVIEVVQDATGSRTLTWGSNFNWPGGEAPTLSTGGGARDLLTFLALSPTVLVGGPIIANHS